MIPLSITSIDDLNPDIYEHHREYATDEGVKHMNAGSYELAMVATMEAQEYKAAEQWCREFQVSRADNGSLLALGYLLHNLSESTDAVSCIMTQQLLKGITLKGERVSAPEMLFAYEEAEKKKRLESLEITHDEEQERIREFGHPLHPIYNRRPHHRMLRRILMEEGIPVIPAHEQYGGNTASVTNEGVRLEVEPEKFDPSVVRRISDTLLDNGFFFTVNHSTEKNVIIVRFNVSGWLDSVEHRGYDGGTPEVISEIESALSKSKQESKTRAKRVK